MRTILISAVAATAAVVGYQFLFLAAEPVQPQAMALQPVASPAFEVRGSLDKLARDLQGYQESNQAQLQQTKEQQTRLNEMLAAMGHRLELLESTAMLQTAQADAATMSSSNAASEGTEEASDDATTGSAKISEANLSEWMEETLRFGYGDRESVELATLQAAESVAKVPGAMLEDMQCDVGFCRATLAHEEGGPVPIRELIGQPPFMNEGFTVEQPDGRVVLYFTQPGQSLEDLRSEAQLYALGTSE